MRGFSVACLCLAFAPAFASLIPGMDGGRATWLATVQREAALRGVPPSLADAVAMIETGYRPDAVGSSGEIGVMQVMPATARQLGFAGTLTDLFLPATNIRLGVTYLSRAWAMSGGNVCRALMKYRAGLGQEAMTPLSMQYCARALNWLASTGSGLAGATPMPDEVAAPLPADPHVIAILPALAAPSRLRPVFVAYRTAGRAMIAAIRPRRTMADRNALLQARIDAHTRPSAAIAAAAAIQTAVNDDSQD